MTRRVWIKDNVTYKPNDDGYLCDEREVPYLDAIRIPYFVVLNSFMRKGSET